MRDDETDTLEKDKIDDELVPDTDVGDDAEDDADGSDADVAEPEITVQIGEEQPEEVEEAPEWVKELRRTNKEQARRIKELEQANAPTAKKLGDKPTLASCDYDEATFETRLAKWHEDKREADAEEQARATERQRQEEAWQQDIRRFEEAKAALKAPDLEDTESVVEDTFSDVQRALIVSVANDAALLRYALGKNPKKAQELAKIADYPKFVAAITRVEMQLKVTHRNAPPPPEGTIKGASGGGTGTDKTLERLEAEAAKTGDRTKIVQYKRKLREKAGA